MQSEQDENMIEMAGDDVDVPEELLKMVDEDATEEEGKDSLLGQIQNLQNMDMDQLKEKASATVTELKTKAEEKCSVMWAAREGMRSQSRGEEEERNEYHHFLGKKTRLVYSQNVKMPAKYSFFLYERKGIIFTRVLYLYRNQSASI